MTKACCTAVLVLGVLVAVPNAQAQTKKVTYAFTDLGALPSPSISSSSSGINNSGQVIGSSLGAGYSAACIWERIAGQWIFQDLGTSQLYNNYSNGLGINELGEVVGNRSTSEAGDTPCYQGYFCGAEGPIALPPGATYTESLTKNVNDYGQVVGQATNDVLGLLQACLWQRDDDGVWTFIDLGATTDCYRSFATDINNSAQVVGYNWDQSVVWQATLWERNEEGQWTMTPLAPGGRSTIACGINDLGQIVGHHKPQDSTTQRACMWEHVDGQWLITDLEVNAPGLYSSRAESINEVEQIVGFSRQIATNKLVNFLYQDGVMYDLNSFLPTGSGWSFFGAQGFCINDLGQIVGTGTSPAGISHAFLMDTRQATYSYTSTGSAVAIKDNASASKAMTLTDNATITDLNVKVTLSHTRYADLKFELIGPDNVTRLLCNAGAVTGSGIKTLVFDDDGTAGSIVPALALSYYDGKSTLGKWTVKISDTVKNSKTGSFTSFTLDVVPAL